MRFTLLIVICSVFISYNLLYSQGSYPILYWTDRTDNDIRRSNYDGTNLETINSNGGAGIAGIDIDLTNGKIYWIDHTTPAIRRSNLNGTNIETVVSSVGSGPHSIALDLTNNKIYWTDQTDNNIRKSNLDGSSIETILSSAGSGLRGIDLDVSNGKMYWADKTDPTIRRSNLDGSSVEALVDPAGSGPYGLALDLSNSKIYWTDETDNNIRSCDLDGSNQTTIISNAGSGLAGISLDVFNNKMYWCDKSDPKIQRANLNGSSVESVLDPSGSGSDGITIDIYNDIPLRITLTTFRALPGDGNIILNWETQSELNNMGFIIEKSTSKESNYVEIASYLNLNALKGQGNSSVSKFYSYTDRNVINGFTYYYKLIDVDVDGTRTEHGPVSVTPNSYSVIVETKKETIVKEFALYQNYPNPFNPLTNISFDLGENHQELININISIYNLIGQRVRTLFDGPLADGNYSIKWNGRDDKGRILPSGQYIYRLNSNHYVDSKRMTLLR